MKRLLCFAVALLSVGSSATAPSIPEIRLTPTAVMSGDKGDNQIGSSKLAGVHTKVLAGNPAATGFYSILLFAPAHTTIQAHSHRDDRMATVVSGNWQFGYGTHFDESALKISGKRLFRTRRSEPFHAHHRRPCGRAYLWIWSHGHTLCQPRRRSRVDAQEMIIVRL